MQFTFDLVDPWWPEPERAAMTRRAAKALADHGLTAHSAYVGLAHWVPAGLLDPSPSGRRAAALWWRRAIDTAAELGAAAVGGPLGTLSVIDAADPSAAETRYRTLVDTVADLSAYARRCGVAEFLIEPTPLPREFPSTPEQAERLIGDLAQRGADNVGLTLDTGHMVFQPLYGPDASVEDWFRPLAPHTRLIHLDNTDGLGDPHWGWPHPQGTFDVARFGRALLAADLGNVPVMLEVFPRFEDGDQNVRDLLISSVAHCKAEFAAAGLG
ncbi:sugar phosphate isomerase/epimerase [Yinghuangia sp. ASG 101]|nr:sugar phosphate isomerase/epimerase [Yinghuangia sp. ASG 101]